MEYREWLQTLKLGDKIAVKKPFSLRSITRIVGETPTQWTLEGFGRAYKKNGLIVGWKFSRIEPIKAKAIQEATNAQR